MGRRNKLTKTCTSCQGKNIKCDRKSPSCTNCLRKKNRCVYNVKLDIVKQEEMRSLTKSQLIATIGQLKNRLKQTTVNRMPNPLCDISYVSCKHGRVLYYVATSFRCAVKSPHLRSHYTEIWQKIKHSRNRWKQEHQFSMESESNSVGVSLSYLNEGSVVDALCTILPSFERVLEYVNIFFESYLFSNFKIVDPSKVLADVRTCFIREKTTFNESRIISIDLGEKRNYYRIGIITEIMCLVHYKEKIPPGIELFHKFITSFVLGKTLYLERVQFFMLRYMYRHITGFTGGDGGNSLSLVALACSTAVHIGLHKSENYIYFKDGPIYLANLWTWILHADFEVSFSLGSPLHVADNLKKGDQPLKQGVSPIFAKAVVLFRSKMNELYSPVSAPNLENIITELKLFLAANFAPISHYLKSNPNEPLEFDKSLVLLNSLQMIANLSLIQLNISKTPSPDLERNVFVCHLSSLKLTLDNMLATYYMCQIRQLDEDRISINFSLAFYLYHGTMPRTTHELFSVLSRSALAISKVSGYPKEAESPASCGTNRNLGDFIKIIDSFQTGTRSLNIDIEASVNFFEQFSRGIFGLLFRETLSMAK